MLTLDEYLADPCGCSSIPWWKAKTMVLPETMQLLHNRDYDPGLTLLWQDQPYFRLYHDLGGIDPVCPPGIRLVTASPRDIPDIVHIINASYTDLQVTQEQIYSYTRTPVYAPALWMMAEECATGRPVGCGIADYDPEARELVLEWIQVLPAFRRRQIGRALVCGLLSRHPQEARFATVSGQVENPANPQALYRRCGFVGTDIWHVLRKR